VATRKIIFAHKSWHSVSVVIIFTLFSPHWTISLAKHSPMTFTNVWKNLITVWNVNQAVGLHALYLMMQKR